MSLQVCGLRLSHTVYHWLALYAWLFLYTSKFKKTNTHTHTQNSREIGRPCGDMIHIYARKEEVSTRSTRFYGQVLSLNGWIDESSENLAIRFEPSARIYVNNNKLKWRIVEGSHFSEWSMHTTTDTAGETTREEIRKYEWNKCNFSTTNWQKNK